MAKRNGLHTKGRKNNNGGIKGSSEGSASTTFGQDKKYFHCHTLSYSKLFLKTIKHQNHLIKLFQQYTLPSLREEKKATYKYL